MDRTIRFILVAVVIIISACATTEQIKYVKSVESESSKRPENPKPRQCTDDGSTSSLQWDIQKAFTNREYDFIYDKIRCHDDGGAGRLALADLMYLQEGMGLRLLGVLILRDDRKLFDTLYPMAMNSEKNEANRSIIIAYRRAWNRCEELTVKAMQKYLRGNRRAEDVKAYIDKCGYLKEVF